MIEFKKYIAQQLIGKKLRFKCDCLLMLDVVGVIKDFQIKSGEIIFFVDIKGKIIEIGENHPTMRVIEI